MGETTVTLKDSRDDTSRPLAFDARWTGDFGIARYSGEVRSRLRSDVLDIADCPTGFSPSAMLAWEAVTGRASQRLGHDTLLLSPSFTPSRAWRGPQAITVHDLIHLEVAEERDWRKELYYKAMVRPAIRANEITFTVSHYSKQRIVEWAGVDPSRVVVTGNAAALTFSPDGDVHRPGYDYILYVRNDKPHKNSVGLVRAFARLPHPDLRLVLSGGADAPSVEAARECGVLDRVVFAGRIPETRLPSYYRGARLAAFPSFYEGFGIPPIEAMSCGTVVVSSDRTSLPEVVADAGVYVDPSDVDSMSDGLERGLTDDPLRAALREKGFARAQHYSWDRIANTVNDAIARL